MSSNPWNRVLRIPDDQKDLSLLKEIRDYVNTVRAIPARRHVKDFHKVPVPLEAKKHLEHLYQSYGIKVLARELGLSYTTTRNAIISYFKIKIRKRGEDSKMSTQFRSDRVKGNRNPFYNWPQKDPTMSNSVGFQGYYRRVSGSYIWLRSSWEYVIARWLDKNEYEWNYESETFHLHNGQTYRPDFILTGNGPKVVIEVKGGDYGINNAHKPVLLAKDREDLVVVIINDIRPFVEKSIAKDVNKWKKERLSKKELSERQLSKAKTCMTSQSKRTTTSLQMAS